MSPVAVDMFDRRSPGFVQNKERSGHMTLNAALLTIKNAWTLAWTSALYFEIVVKAGVKA